jgi:hypothetical protein
VSIIREKDGTGKVAEVMEQWSDGIMPSTQVVAGPVNTLVLHRFNAVFSCFCLVFSLTLPY